MSDTETNPVVAALSKLPRLERLENVYDMGLARLCEMILDKEGSAGPFSAVLGRIRQEIQDEKELKGLTESKNLTIVFKDYDDMKKEINDNLATKVD